MLNKSNSPTKELVKSYVIEKGARGAALQAVVKFAEMQTQLAKYVADTDYSRDKIIRLHGDITYILLAIEEALDITQDELLQGHTLANMAILEQIERGN